MLKSAAKPTRLMILQDEFTVGISTTRVIPRDLRDDAETASATSLNRRLDLPAQRAFFDAVHVFETVVHIGDAGMIAMIRKSRGFRRGEISWFIAARRPPCRGCRDRQ